MTADGEDGDPSDLVREAAEAVVWLGDDQVAELLRMLIANDSIGASRMLAAAVPEIEHIEFEAWREALIAELQFRIEPTAEAPRAT